MLKWLGLYAMTVDHFGVVAFDRPFLASLVGRLAFPIFAGLVGINVMRSRYPGRYVAYMLLAAVISQPVVMWALDRSAGIPLNVLFTLGIGAALAAVLFRDLEESTRWVLLLLTGAGLVAVPWVEYGVAGVSLIVAIAATIRLYRWHWSAGLVAAGSVPLLAWMVNGGYPPYSIIAVLTVCLVGLVVARGDRKGGDRWFFYVYYPVHMAVLALASVLFI